jgi:hypothetical protein
MNCVPLEELNELYSDEEGVYEMYEKLGDVYSNITKIMNLRQKKIDTI